MKENLKDILPPKQYTRMQRAIRRAARCGGSTWPIVVVDGDTPPTREGESYFHTTLSGKIIVEHPNAYGWPTRYHPSTNRIEVGRDWLSRHGVGDNQVTIVEVKERCITRATAKALKSSKVPS